MADISTSTDLHAEMQLVREDIRRLSVDRGPGPSHTLGPTPCDSIATISFPSLGMLDYCIDAVGGMVNTNHYSATVGEQILEYLLSVRALGQTQNIHPSPAAKEKQQSHELSDKKALLNLVGSDGLCLACRNIFKGHISDKSYAIKDEQFVPIAFCYFMANSGCRLCQVLLKEIDSRTLQAVLRHSVSYPSGSTEQAGYTIHATKRNSLQSLRLVLLFECRNLEDVRDTEVPGEMFDFSSEVETNYCQRKIGQTINDMGDSGNARNLAFPSQKHCKSIRLLTAVQLLT
jgi:hypothetical protein